MSIAALVDSLQIFLSLKQNQFSASGTTSDSEALLQAADRTRPQRTKPSDLKGIPTSLHRWRETSDILHAIAAQEFLLYAIAC
jgi:hypothetical protein